MEQTFETLGLCESILKVVAAKKFKTPSEIQEKTIPLIFAGKDVIAGSKTGSGKTLAFSAGIIKDTLHRKKIQALILTPTRELAEQVSEAIREFSYYKKLEVVAVYGGVSIENQIKKLAYADIVVATPGRLLDHLGRNSIDLSLVTTLVLDEADRMWDMGFKEDVGKIVKACPEKKQTLLFSATISGDLAGFSKRYMNNPVEVSVEHFVDASKLKQTYYDVRDSEKFSLLVHLLKKETAHLAMIFCNTRRNADFVAKNLKENGINAQVIHGGMEQNKRMRVLKSFDNLKINILVCTDVAARGLDIPDVSHVYNYDIASDPRDYVHRIGRTARAGKEGVAINILASRDYDNFANVQKHNQGLVINREHTPHFEKIYVKWDAPKPRGGRNFGGRGGRDNRSGGRRNFSRGPRSSSGNGQRRTRGSSDSSRKPFSRGNSTSRSYSGSHSSSRGREERGKRNKRRNDSGDRRDASSNKGRTHSYSRR